MRPFFVNISYNCLVNILLYMIIITQNIIKILPIIWLELCHKTKENSILAITNLFTSILLILKNHFKYQFKVLTCISGVDYPENLNRFQIVYELLSIKYNIRLWLKIVTNELISRANINLFRVFAKLKCISP